MNTNKIEGQRPLRPFRRSDEERKAMRAAMAKSRREYNKTLSPEDKERLKKERRWRMEDNQTRREEKQEQRQQKLDNKAELAILQYMLKTDVLSYHHGYSESLKEEVQKQIAKLKESGKHKEYDPYIWNRQGEGNNYMSLSVMRRIWHHIDFHTIYEVPLDGSYIFYAYDSGDRGSGSYNRISCHKVDEEPYVKKVNPGSYLNF
jgi:hypothetical protein